MLESARKLKSKRLYSYAKRRLLRKSRYLHSGDHAKAAHTPESSFYVHTDRPTPSLDQRIWAVCFYLRQDNSKPKLFAQWYWVKDMFHLGDKFHAEPFHLRGGLHAKLRKSVNDKLQELIQE